MTTARPFLISITTLLFHIGSLIHSGTEIPGMVSDRPVDGAVSTYADKVPPAPASIVSAADMTAAYTAISFTPLVPATGSEASAMGSTAAGVPVSLVSASMTAVDMMMACSSSDEGLLGPCSRAGCSGRDDYCKSYVVFDFLGLTLYRHCTGELRERVVNPSRR
jgi:hypothetical protein